MKKKTEPPSAVINTVKMMATVALSMVRGNVLVGRNIEVSSTRKGHF